MEGVEYLVHPMRVCALLADYTRNPVELAIALTHDVIEDSDISKKEFISILDDIDAEDVYEGSLNLCNNREEIKRMGKAEYLYAKMYHLSDRDLLIKLCDRFDNVSSLSNPKTPIKFVKKYVKETRHILGNLYPDYISRKEKDENCVEMMRRISDELDVVEEARGLIKT